jgi:hypothetical protein
MAEGEDLTQASEQSSTEGTGTENAEVFTRSDDQEEPVLTAQSAPVPEPEPAEKKVFAWEERFVQVEGAIKHLAKVLGHDIESLFPALK